MMRTDITAPLVATGLVGGYLTARLTGVRPLGGVVLGAAGLASAATWAKRDGVPTAAALLGVYLGAFGGSHPLAKKIGAWPSVGLVTVAAAGTAYAVSDRKALSRG